MSSAHKRMRASEMPVSPRPARRAEPRIRNPHPPRRSHPPRVKLRRVSIQAVLVLALVLVSLAVSGGLAGRFLDGWAAAPVQEGAAVTERGDLESQENVEVVCEVDDIHGDSIDGTPLLWIIPNGTMVSMGDLLVELDSASHQERLDNQILTSERARSEQIQTLSRYENQITQNQTSTADAELRLRLTQLELQMFSDQKSGTHKLEVEAINRGIDDVNNDIMAAQATLELRKNTKLGIESLFKMGYAGKSELDRTRLDFLRAENEYATNLNRLQARLASLDRKQTYEHEMQLLRLQGNLQSARRNVEQVSLNNEARLAQAKAAVDASERSLKKHEERLARYQNQLAKCNIVAPQEGMVVYASSNGTSGHGAIGDGAVIRERQHILSLPNLAKMQVKTAVHESVVGQVIVGLAATVRLDACPDRTYRGTVRSVATLPDRCDSSSTESKKYETIVTIDEKVTRLKPGMAAVVHIDVGLTAEVPNAPWEAIAVNRGR